MDRAVSDVDFGLLAGDGIAARSARAGEIIFKEGDEAEQLFVIKSGQVRIQLGSRAFSQQHIWRDGVDRRRAA
jgi:CRP/FNR family transcriptional regulator, cyclic AMP receptor protein